MLGSAIGAIAAMLFTTKKGHSIQDNLLSQYRTFEGKVKKSARHHKQKAQRAAKQIAKHIAKKIKRVRG